MRKICLSLALLALAAATGAVAVPAPASAAAGLTAAFSTTDNGSWHLDKYVVTNPTGAAVIGWTLEFDLPAGVTLGNVYNGTASQSGSRVTIVNAHYNGTVAAGASTEPFSPWFIAYGSGAAPLNCRINGNKCDGSADRAPGTPTGLAVTGRTTRTVSLSWTAAAATDFPIAGYDVLSGSSIVASGTGTSAVVTGLTPSSAYTFAVRAKDTRGNISARPASSTASTSTGSGRGRRGTRATTSARPTRPTTPLSWPSSAASSTRSAGPPASVTC